MSKRRQLPAETHHYVRIITGIPAEVWARKITKARQTRFPSHAHCPDGTLPAQTDKSAKPGLRTSVQPPRRQTRLSGLALVRPGAATINKHPLASRSMARAPQSNAGLSVHRFATKAKPETVQGRSHIETVRGLVTFASKAARQHPSELAKLAVSSKRNTATVQTKTALSFAQPSPSVE